MMEVIDFNSFRILFANCMKHDCSHISEPFIANRFCGLSMGGYISLGELLSTISPSNQYVSGHRMPRKQRLAGPRCRVFRAMLP